MVPDFKVIGCETKEIVSAPEKVHYLALSYIWGLSLPRKSSLGINSFPSDHVPQVIEDAMEVTKKLQYRYLWVDRYCIPQNDEDPKLQRINFIGSIYSNADVTVVAAAGEDPSFGLPGAGSRARRCQPHVKLPQCTLLSMLPAPAPQIRNSKWMSRGWTYQEAMLSKRLLFFTVNQLYFECRAMHCSEAVAIPLSLLHAYDRQVFREDLHPGLFPPNRKSFGPRDMCEGIKAYSERFLTNDHDSLNAILGVLQR